MAQKKCIRTAMRTHKVIEVNNHVLSLHGKRKIVNVDLDRQGTIWGGLLMGASILVMSIIIPILLG